MPVRCFTGRVNLVKYLTVVKEEKKKLANARKTRGSTQALKLRGRKTPRERLLI